MGDMHQPLHLGYAVDKGGNSFQIAFDRRVAARPPAAEGDSKARAQQRWWQDRRFGYNLHSLWDIQLLESAAHRESDYLKLLEELPAVSASRRRSSLAAIAQESCQIMRRADFYPKNHRINHAYVLRQRPVAEVQLRLAAERLADLLNRVLRN